MLLAFFSFLSTNKSDGLAFDQFSEDAVRYGHEGLVSSQFDHFAFLQNGNLRGFAYSRQTMSDGQHGAAFHNTFQRLLDQRFAFGVQGACRLVQQQYPRILAKQGKENE